MSAVIEAKTLPIERPTTEAAALLQVIERAATNPEVDIAKLEKLLEMHERIVAGNALAAFNQAMTDCQSEMRAVGANADNPQTRSRYATYAKLDATLRPIYNKHGFAISFDTGDIDKPEAVRVLAYVSRGGYTRTYKVDVPADGKGAKGGDVMTKTHAVGAAMSYGARYLLKFIFNVAVGEDDADGNGPKDGPPPDEAGKKALEACGSRSAVAAAWNKLTQEKRAGLLQVRDACLKRIAEADKAAAAA